ncbi:M81 family metallopeptidase [Stenotrophobium rhamnosiphilum]|uniref:Microcystinase C n=1 Tax=Stenotrophobium rhamnosiphilum TaxID=2029166 RepID=A0A2T5MKJ7_9GAMM|nr:M81 family metallopeptidase [Stenotrophobium rhamnosiphilum]PTU33090.1 microcystin LR degradation protein MlrC-like protein [Stenotrophobium rhamnosiphilum]
MKIFAATFATETNTFAVAPTGRIDFEAVGVFHGDGSALSPTGIGIFHAELQKLAAADGHQLVESLAAFAQPSGPTLRAVYEEFRQTILDDLKAAMPVDAVLLVLHGAMVAQGYDDCEGDLTQHVREIVGPNVPIGMELDLHCHYTQLMRKSADIIIAYKEYPHTDGLDRLRELYVLTTQQAKGNIKPVTAVHDCRMVGIWHTTKEPMISFVKRMQSFEGKDGVLSVSLGHGFPWGDVVENGAMLWVVTDNDLEKADALAKQLGREFWDLRAQTYEAPMTIAAALTEANAEKAGPVVLADIGDNAGGGAMSDSTFVLKQMIEMGISNAAIGAFWDLGAVAICKSAGVGAEINLRLGGKCGPQSGDPIDVRVTVRAINDEHSQRGLGAIYPLGTGVWVQTQNGIDIVLNTRRTQVFSPDAFENLGISMEDKQMIIVKSSQHFHALFAPIAKKVLYIGTPGSTSQTFADIPFVKRSLNYWPKVENPS